MYTDFKQIKCKDGTIKFILNKIEDIRKAFSLYAPEIDFNLISSLHIAKNIAEGEGQGELKKKAIQIFENLDRIHSYFVQKFTTVYTLFMASPCDEAAYKNLSNTIREMYASLDTLRQLESEMRNLSRKHLGSSNIAITNKINSYIKDLENSYIPSLVAPNEQIHTQIERYPYARFPDKIYLNDIIPLEIIIKSYIPNYEKAISITLDVNNKNQKEIPVQVIIECEDDGLEIDGKYYATINVPVNVKDSNPVIFNVKSKKIGKHTIYVRFYQQETYVGEIKLESITIVPNTPKSIIKPVYQNKEWKSNYTILENTIPGPPDVTIIIIEKKISSDFEYSVLVISSDIPMQEMGPIKFQSNPETKFHKIFDEIENLNAPSVTIIDRNIQAIGMNLYDELFPESVKELYWKIRDKIKSIRIISKEPWIPWEIIKPWRKLEDENIEEDSFLCERYAFSRWIDGKHERIKKEIKKIKVIIPNDTNLTAAIIERDWILGFADQRNIEFSVDSSYDQVINTLETEKEIDILHFSTHGQGDKESALSSVIELQGKLQLRPKEIVGKTMTFGQSYPIVILNACQTGTQGFSLTGIQGWATKFLEAGASVFIGTLWSVNDETAFNFVKEFYNQLSSGISLGESVKNARNKCKKQGDTSWLAYQLYGHPNSKIAF